MRVLVTGSGGREHAIVDALRRSPGVREVFAAPGNGGIREQAEIVPLAADDIDGLLEFARQRTVDLTFVGPELPLQRGIVDRFRSAGLRIVGPGGHLAQLESSKSFTKRLCTTHGIPTAAYVECRSPAEALAALSRFTYPIVIKADGLAAGKGVVIAATRDEAESAIHAFMEDRTLGTAGDRLVIEEFLEGTEASLLVFANGRSFQTMVPAQDHKRRFDGDTGPNTGGMGAYSCDGILSDKDLDFARRRIIQPTLEAVGTYNGILYAGLMLTSEGPKLLEYNVRFGDPETQVILPRLKSNLAEVLMAMAEDRLDRISLEWSAEAVATVVLVAAGYPGKVESGKPISGIQEAEKIDGIRVYHAGTRFENGQVFTAGGRVLNVTARGATLADALGRAYAACAVIRFDGKDFRSDIGRKGLKAS